MSTKRMVLGWKPVSLSPLRAILCLALSVALACGTAAGEPADSNVLARIGDTEVKLQDVRAAFGDLDPRDQAAMAHDPAVLNQAVRSLLIQRIVLKEALSKKWDQQPTVVAQLQRLRESAISESYLRETSKPPEGFPSDSELQSAYDARKTGLFVARQFRLSQIFIALSKDAAKDVEEKVQSRIGGIRKHLLQPNADFAAIARAESEDKESAARGGEIGWLTEAEIQPELRAEVITLAINAISDPIRLNDGWHILRCLEIKDAYTPSLSEARDRLVQQLRAERSHANRGAYLATLLQENPVSINQLALSKLLNKVEK